MDDDSRGERQPESTLPAEESTLADEVAAEIELGLPQAARRAVQRLGRLNDVASRLASGGLVRKLPLDPFDSSHLEAVGVSTRTSMRPAFGGLLYGASALAFGLRMVRNDVLDAWQVSRVQVGDIDFYGKDERIRWKQLLLVYEILEVLLAERQPQLILLDLPLFISRREEATVADDPMTAAEWGAIESRVNGFWRGNSGHVYPFVPHGTIVASLRPHSATSLFSALLSNPGTSPDPLQDELLSFIRQNCAVLGQLGQARLLDRVLEPSTRSCAYSYEDLDLDPRWQPEELHHVGILGLFVRARHRTGVWHLQVPGHRTQWSPEALDCLGVNLVRATLFDDHLALPLPLWYASKFARFPDQLLTAYQQRIEEELKSDEQR